MSPSPGWRRLATEPDSPPDRVDSCRSFPMRAHEPYAPRGRNRGRNRLTADRRLLEYPARPSGNSSVGRAQPCQGWGREFESRFPLQIPHRSTTARRHRLMVRAEWQSGHAAACKAVYAGSIPTSASISFASPALPAIPASARRGCAAMEFRCDSDHQGVQPRGFRGPAPAWRKLLPHFARRLHCGRASLSCGPQSPGWRNWQTQRTRRGPPRGNAWVHRGQIRGTLNRSS